MADPEPDPDLADRLDRDREPIAAATTQTLFASNPDWEDRWGAQARSATRNDVAFTVAFLAAAIRAGEAEIFLDYVEWLRGVLSPRGVDDDVIRTTHEALADEIGSRLPDAQAEAALGVLEAGHRALEGPIESEEPPDLDEATERLVEALLDGEREPCEAIVEDQIQAGRTPTDVAEDVVGPAMREIGRRWQASEVSVADEHMATVLARKILVDLYSQRDFAPEGQGRALLACVEGGRHDLGLQIVADALEEDGWTTRNLGADVPVKDLVRHADDWRPDLLCLSLSMPQQIDAARRSIDGVRDRFGTEDPWILLGGRVLNRFPHLHQVLGADGWAPGSREAVLAAKQRGHDR